MNIATQTTGFLIDLDGTIYAGEQLIDGAKEAIEYLQEHSYPFVFVSNRGNYSRLTCKRKLERMGIYVHEEQIVLTSTVAAHYLATHHPQDSIWVLGNDELRQELVVHGLTLADQPQQAGWLIITLHEQLTYEELNAAFRAVQAGANIIATNADRTFPRHDGNCIDVAGMIGAIAYSTGKEPEVIVGKPSHHIAQYALSRLNVAPENCIVIGDSLNSDLMLARKFNMKAAIVLSGSTTMEIYNSHDVKADWVADNIYTFVKHLTHASQ